MGMLKSVVTSKLAAAGILIDGHRPWDIRNVKPRFYLRAAVFGSLGVGDSYTDGDFECDDVGAFVEKWTRFQMKCRIAQLEQSDKNAHNYEPVTSLPEWWIWLKRKRGNQQSIKRSKRVGREHYDLDKIYDKLYPKMLGPTMAYSCGYWEGAETLEQAQLNKYRVICEKLGLKRGMRVLEIGCGWGGFAAFAVKEYGVTVVGVSISREQINFVKAKHKDLCDAGSLDLRFMDYREIPEKFPKEFDRVVSIGMFEHVGPKNYDDYMRIVWLALKPGGTFLLHTIIGNDGADPFIWYRIFPGGVLPIEEQIARAAKPYFAYEHGENFGFDYSRTLDAWWENFKAAWPTIRKGDDYDDKFYRMWEFYLRSCAAAFRARKIHLQHWVFTKLDPANENARGYEYGRFASSSRIAA